MSGPDKVDPDEQLSVVGFYDRLADDYQLVYGGHWDAAVERQGSSLDRLIRETLPGASDVLDCSCGIGTQAIGLALRGYRVHGSDVSAREIEQARIEAERLGAAVTFGVADFRDLSAVAGDFDVVISCDNAVPHLLDEQDVLQALREMRSKLRPGGLLIVTMRDFDLAAIERPTAAPLVDVPGPPRRVIVRLHDWDADRPIYTVRYLVLTEQPAGWTVVEHATQYRAIARDELTRAARAAGFSAVTWHGPELAVVGDQRVLTARNVGSRTSR